MSDSKPFRELAAGMCNWIVPPNVLGMISGTRYAKQTSDGVITLTYEDGSEESRKSDKDAMTEFDSYLAIVSFVQAARATLEQVQP